MQDSTKLTLAELIDLLHSQTEETGEPGAVVITDEGSGFEYIFAFYSEEEEALDETPTGEGKEDPDDR